VKRELLSKERTYIFRQSRMLITFVLRERRRHRQLANSHYRLISAAFQEYIHRRRRLCSEQTNLETNAYLAPVQMANDPERTITDANDKANTLIGDCLLHRKTGGVF